jgi:hypothetical protein
MKKKDKAKAITLAPSISNFFPRISPPLVSCATAEVIEQEPVKLSAEGEVEISPNAITEKENDFPTDICDDPMNEVVEVIAVDIGVTEIESNADQSLIEDFNSSGRPKRRAVVEAQKRQEQLKVASEELSRVLRIGSAIKSQLRYLFNA